MTTKSPEDRECERVPQPAFIDGVARALSRALISTPLRQGDDWYNSFECPHCKDPMTVLITWRNPLKVVSRAELANLETLTKAETDRFVTVQTGADEQNVVLVDVECNCRVDHACGEPKPPGCGQGYRYALPLSTTGSSERSLEV